MKPTPAILELADALRALTDYPDDQATADALVATAERIAPPPSRSTVAEIASHAAATAREPGPQVVRSTQQTAARSRPRWRARLITTVAAWGLWAKLATAAVATAAVTAGLGSAGALPDGMQEVVAEVGGIVGLDLPDPRPAAPTASTTPVSESANSSEPDVATPEIDEPAMPTSTAPITDTSAIAGEAEVRTYRVGEAGWVTVRSDGVRLVLVEVVAAEGWSWEVTDLKDDQIDVTFSHPETDATFTAQLNDGVVKIDIDPGDLISD